MDQSSGALVGSVEKGTPADIAGLKTGDIITAVNGAPVEGSSDVRNRVGLSPVGTTLDLTVLRGSDVRKVKVTIGKAAEARVQKASLEEAKPAVKGASFSDNLNGKGVTVTNVEQGSPAWMSGLRPKDVVVAVNRKPVTSVDQLNDQLKDSNRETALFLKRDGQDMLVVVQ